jgi:hypothetical protein
MPYVALITDTARYLSFSDVTDALDLSAEQVQPITRELGRHFTWGNPHGLTLADASVCARVIEDALGADMERITLLYAMLADCQYLNLED